ncbi:MAG TPA: aspartyl/asparaginyl beta-hydroxylase domain-containing protein [Ramlibacter sp.]|nr:aspartyl/asparaginyl beta-hydroxylase domain-containing protein [Ramlibacter sp.]
MKWLVVAVYAACIAWIQFRGHVRHRWAKQLFDHSTFVAPVNVLLYAFSRVPARPYLALETWPDLRQLESQWRTIRDEAEALRQARALKAAEKNDDAGFNSFFKEGWTRFYLKWYDADPGSAVRLCPRTVEILRRLPSVKAALFAELPPGAKLNPHRDPFAGSLRYHLGLDTPNDDRCCIWVDGEPYSWRDGQGVVFDETFIHWARNGTDKSRLILLCDIERPMKFRWASALNRWLGRHAMAAAASPNQQGDRTGLINRLFIISYYAGQLRRRFKRWNPVVYRITKFALIAAVAAAIAFW